MKKIFITIFSLLLFFPTVVSARNYRLVNTRLYGGSLDEQVFDFIPLADGGYVLAGGSYSTDISGITNKGESDCLLIRVDSNRDVMWTRAAGGTKTDFCTNIVEYHGDLVTTVMSFSSPYTSNSNPGMGILRYDINAGYKTGFAISNSSPIYASLYNDSVLLSYTSASGSYIATINDESFADNNFDVRYKIHSANTLENYKFFQKDNNKFDVIGNATTALNSSITNKGNQYVTIINHTFNNTNDITINAYGGTGYDAAFDAVEDEEYYYIAGTSDSSSFDGTARIGGFDAFLLKVRKDDKSVVFVKRYGGTDRDVGASIYLLPNGNLLMNIQTSSNFSNHESQATDFALFELDKDGNVINEWFYGEEGLDSARSIIANNDGSLTLVGQTDSSTFNNISTHGEMDIFLTDAYLEYDVDIANTTHGSVTTDKENGILNEDITITTTPDEGYEVDSLIVVDSEGNIVTVTNNVFKINNKDVTVYVTFKPSTYEFTKKDKKYQNKDMSFALDVSTSKISKIYINDKELDSDNYILEDNKITIKNDYLTTLENGTYTLKVEFANGTNITTDISKVPEEKIVNPNTGLDISILYSIPIIIGMIIILFKNKNKYSLFKRL